HGALHLSPQLVGKDRDRIDVERHLALGSLGLKAAPSLDSMYRTQLAFIPQSGDNLGQQRLPFSVGYGCRGLLASARGRSRDVEHRHLSEARQRPVEIGSLAYH